MLDLLYLLGLCKILPQHILNYKPVPVSRKNTIRAVLDRLCNRSTGRKLLQRRRDEGRREVSRTAEIIGRPAGRLPQAGRPDGRERAVKTAHQALARAGAASRVGVHLGHAWNGGGRESGRRDAYRQAPQDEFGELPIEMPRDRHGTFEPPRYPFINV